jgi:hypothetical protein
MPAEDLRGRLPLDGSFAIGRRAGEKPRWHRVPTSFSLNRRARSRSAPPLVDGVSLPFSPRARTSAVCKSTGPLRRQKSSPRACGIAREPNARTADRGRSRTGSPCTPPTRDW